MGLRARERGTEADGQRSEKWHSRNLTMTGKWNESESSGQNRKSDRKVGLIVMENFPHCCCSLQDKDKSKTHFLLVYNKGLL